MCFNQDILLVDSEGRMLFLLFEVEGGWRMENGEGRMEKEG